MIKIFLMFAIFAAFLVCGSLAIENEKSLTITELSDEVSFNVPEMATNTALEYSYELEIAKSEMDLNMRGSYIRDLGELSILKYPQSRAASHQYSHNLGAYGFT